MAVDFRIRLKTSDRVINGLEVVIPSGYELYQKSIHKILFHNTMYCAGFQPVFQINNFDEGLMNFEGILILYYRTQLT